MTILSQLASSLKRRDEIANQVLAEKIAEDNNLEAVNELAGLLQHQSKDIQNDAIKVLYEIGERKPAMLSAHMDKFLPLLSHRNNRLQWGAMAALACITRDNPQGIFTSLPAILKAADSGSVITRDETVKILIALCSLKPYAADVFPVFIEQLLKSPVNQVPMYAENAIPVIHEKNKAVFIKVLQSRLGDIEKESKRKRVEKVIRKLA